MGGAPGSVLRPRAAAGHRAGQAQSHDATPIAFIVQAPPSPLSTAAAARGRNPEAGGKVSVRRSISKDIEQELPLAPCRVALGLQASYNEARRKHEMETAAAPGISLDEAGRALLE